MKYLALILLLSVTNIALSQNYFYLENIQLKEKSDYTANEENAIKAIDYMMNSPINEQDMDRKACTRFIIRYAEGSPFVTVSIESYVIKIYKKNLDLLSMYMGLWVKSSIQNKEGKPEDHEKFTVTEIYKYVEAGNGIKITETLNSLINAGNDKKIDDWIKKMKK